MLNGFYEIDGIAWAISRIVRVGSQQPVKGSRAYVRHISVDDNGQRREIADYSPDRLLTRPVQLIPSEPGCRLVRTEEGQVWGEPLIAWALCFDGEIRPVTANGVNGGESDTFPHWVQMNDGTVQGVGEHSDPCCFGSADEFVRHFTPSPSGDAA